MLPRVSVRKLNAGRVFFCHTFQDFNNQTDRSLGFNGHPACPPSPSRLLVLPEVDTWDLRSRRFVRLEIRGLARSREMSKLIGRFDANLASNLRERERVDEEIARSNGPLYSSRISAREKIRNCRNGEQESLAGSRFPETVALSPRAGTSRILTQDFPFAQTLARARSPLFDGD